MTFPLHISKYGNAIDSTWDISLLVRPYIAHKVKSVLVNMHIPSIRSRACRPCCVKPATRLARIPLLAPGPLIVGVAI